jgi:transcription initiation factor TFIID subunit 2
VSTTPPEKAELQGDHLPQIEDPRVEINKSILGVALAEVERYRDMDRVIPSWRNVITVSILEVRMDLALLLFHLTPPVQFNAMLMMANCIPNNPAFFLLYTRHVSILPLIRFR